MSAADTRNMIVEVADRLFYENGYEHTSFADIAARVKISRGNFYYHFKTKDEILAAVIERRLSDRGTMLLQWELDAPDPLARITCFIKILITNQTKIMAYGCPVGTLSSELAKLNHPLSGEAVKLFTLFRDWLTQQFEAGGCGPQSGEFALHILSRSQGAAMLANAYRDPAFVQREVDEMCEWCAKRLTRTS
ncbi:TetR/AcrR family transcriptional regulator [Rhizobium sp. L1K21]|uniref:TetR/AcrR family transcriptional regulator n=1 Tax=Rhizobium sp. L1K21 TaxID=2954933 RepID=UPI002092D889|nr:TetR/AcrR family transcriptional regulator [Rhizobium sp. L1K21]MCO6186917.1 TetR/AcrR family transcriptional regulator [Rhizobium sp. L1K21]